VGPVASILRSIMMIHSVAACPKWESTGPHERSCVSPPARNKGSSVSEPSSKRFKRIGTFLEEVRTDVARADATTHKWIGPTPP
jgi:hypothetical protein